MNKMHRCISCNYCKKVYQKNNLAFLGCHHSPYKGKWIAEIEDCPVTSYYSEVKDGRNNY